MLDLRDLGQRIRQQRLRLGLKQQDIAHALQISPQSVSKWERGENGPDIATLGPLSTLLGVTTDWLLGRFEENQDVFEATVLASSVSGAYKKSREVKARDFAGWANGYFYQLTEAVLRYDGVPIKYMGDEFLCFFSGNQHRARAVDAVRLATHMVTEDIKVGLNTGEIYLGSIGHPDYAHPDIMGETVNIAFLIMRWAETNTKSGCAAAVSVVDDLDVKPRIGKARLVEFLDVANPVKVAELKNN